MEGSLNVISKIKLVAAQHLDGGVLFRKLACVHHHHSNATVIMEIRLSVQLFVKINENSSIHQSH